MARNNASTPPEAGVESTRLRRLAPTFDRFGGRHYGGLAASLALHFIVLTSLWWTQHTPLPPKPHLVEVEIIQAELIKTASRVTPSKTTKTSTRESKLRQKLPKPKHPPEQKPELQEAIQEYEMDATVVKAGKRGGKLRSKTAKVALPDVSRPVTLTARAALNRSPEQSAAASLQQAEQRGTLKPRLSSVGQQASSRLQLPSRAGVESENGPQLIARNAPAAQTLAPEYRHSSRPGGKYSSQGGAAQPAMGGGASSEAAQAYSLQSSNASGSPAGNPAAAAYAANAAPSTAPVGVTGTAPAGVAGRTQGQTSSPVATGTARSGAATPTEIRSSGGQSEVAASGAPINPMQINSAGGAAGAVRAAGATGGVDVSQPGTGGSGRGMEEGGGTGALLAAGGSGRSISGAASGMSAAIVPDGGNAMSSGLKDDTGASPMQQVQARGTAYATEERYATQALKVHSPRSVFELPLMMAGFDRRPLPEGLANIMGSESAMRMEAPPVLLPGNIQPTYPLAALAGRQQGKAVVRAQVLPSGQVGEAFIRDSSGYTLLDQAAVATVRNWRFKPARRNAQPVSAWVNVPIEYRNPS